MNKSYTQNNFLLYLVILGAFFILLFVTKNVFGQTQILLDEQQRQKSEEQTLSSSLDRLNALQDQIAQEGGEVQTQIKGFLSQPSEDELLEYIYGYASSLNSGSQRMIIQSITLSPEIKSDIGFSQKSVDISAIFSSETGMFDFINFLINPEGKYRMYIQKFEYPMNQGAGNISVQIPLTLLYK